LDDCTDVAAELALLPFSVLPVDPVPRGVVGGVTFRFNNIQEMLATAQDSPVAPGTGEGQPDEIHGKFRAISYPDRSDLVWFDRWIDHLRLTYLTAAEIEIVSP